VGYGENGHEFFCEKGARPRTVVGAQADGQKDSFRISFRLCTDGPRKSRIWIGTFQGRPRAIVLIGLMYESQYFDGRRSWKERFSDGISLSPFGVPKGLEVFFKQRLAVAPWNFDIVNGVRRVVDCRSGCLVCKLIAMNVPVSRDPVELDVNQLSQEIKCFFFLFFFYDGDGFRR
jgi:hypothetical protein